jgi:putative hydrolase of the HAD superfamily
MSPLSAVIFDMNDVLCRYDRAARILSIANASHREPAAIEAAIWGSGYEDLADTGAMDADDYLRGFGERIGYALTLQEWIAAMRGALSPLPKALRLAVEIGSNARIAVLTNNNYLVAREIDVLFPELRRAFGEFFFVSAEFRARKPNPEVYRRCVARLGEPAQATLFVDDSLTNVAGAKRAKLHGHLYVGPEALARAVKRWFPALSTSMI